jgi:hypothetical protein
MSTLAFLHSFAAALGLSVAGVQAPAQVESLIAQLGSKSFVERERATRTLDLVGPAALERLRKVADSTSAEVRRRAGDLVRRIERRVLAARILTPARIRLSYQEVPVPDAVTDLMKRTGFPMRLEGDLTRLASRRLTLHTEEMPFWEAFDLFCRKAELAEVEPLAQQLPPRGNGVSVTIVGGVGGGPAAAKDVMRPPPSEATPPLVLIDRRGGAEPTHIAGPVRIRALPPGTPLAVTPNAGETVLGLEATAAPALRWQEVVGIRLDRVEDAEGNLLRGRHAPPRPEPSARGGVVIINGEVIRPPEDRPPARRFPILIGSGGKAVSRLREVRGVISAVVLSAPQTLLTVDGILKAAGKKFDGPAGVWLHVHEVKRGDDGRYTVRFEVEPPARATGDGSTRTSSMNRMILINGRRLGETEETLSALNFALLDAKGRPLGINRAVNTGRRQGPSREYEFTFDPAAGQGEPARLVYRDRLSAVVEVPFTLRNVPLR